MEPNLFKEKMLSADPRNKFAKLELTDAELKYLASKGEGLKEFFSSLNPQGTEAYVKGLGEIYFVSFEELPDLQKEYDCDDYFIFAVIGGDPVAIKDNKVYRGTHGTEDYGFELVAESFSELIRLICESL